MFQCFAWPQVSEALCSVSTNSLPLSPPRPPPAPQFPVGRSSHTVKWEGVWRELGCLARSASFAVREER